MDITKAILHLNPHALVHVIGSDLDTCEITWVDGTPPIEKADIRTAMETLYAQYQANDYQRQRAVTYWPLADQLDAMYWDRKNGTNIWEQHIEAVKNTFPKP